MSIDKTGGPAFPCDAIFGRDESGRPTETNSEGMTLRDYFAAKAIQSILNNLPQGIQPQDCLAAAEDAYFIADRMLEARKS